VPRQSDRAGDKGEITGQHILAQQRFCDAGSEKGGHLDQLRRRFANAYTYKDGYFVAGIQDEASKGLRLQPSSVFLKTTPASSRDRRCSSPYSTCDFRHLSWRRFLVLGWWSV
jgi:hypothetical protein